MKIDTSNLIPNVKCCNKQFDIDNFRSFMLSTAVTVGQILKDKEEYKEQRKHTNDSKEDS